MLREIFNRWEELLATLSEGQITATDLPDGWSIKDEMAHLWGWQQRSVARMNAALNNTEPHYPNWLGSSQADPEEDVDKTNDWIYQTYKDEPWQAVYADWRTQFLRLLELTAQIPEKDLLDSARYVWMEGYPLAASHKGTYEHHEEHYNTLSAWLKQERA